MRPQTSARQEPLPWKKRSKTTEGGMKKHASKVALPATHAISGCISPTAQTHTLMTEMVCVKTAPISAGRGRSTETEQLTSQRLILTRIILPGRWGLVTVIKTETLFQR
jgi:hypothetical protein